MLLKQTHKLFILATDFFVNATDERNGFVVVSF